MQIFNYNEIDLSKVIRVINLVVPASKAQLGPPVGPALSQARLKAKDFCDLFNNVTNNYEENFPLRVVVFVLPEKRFNFFIKTPTITTLLNFFSKNKNQISLLDIYKIAKIKEIDINYLSLNVLYLNILNYVKQKKIKIKR
jgi:ribosomal protein L11